MVDRMTQKLLETETRQKSREVKDTQTLRMWCVEQTMRAEGQFVDPIAFAKQIENYVLGRVVS